MKYIVGFLLINISATVMLDGMDRGSRTKQNHVAHSYYFFHAVTALERRDQERLELYCNLDPKLVAEIEKTIAQNAEQTKWAMGIVGDIKARARL